jgi:hypothetical protein
VLSPGWPRWLKGSERASCGATRAAIKMPVVVQWQNTAIAEMEKGLRRPGFDTPAGSSF